MKLQISSKILLFVLGSVLYAGAAMSQSSKEKKVIADAEEARAEFIKTDPLMQSLFSSAHGYVIFPNVGKGAVGVGGASGNGAVYEGGSLIGKAKLSQLTIGFQFGGQAYQEVVFFENAAAMERFKSDKVEFSAQASAVAAKSGASADAKYRDGIMIFTQTKGGLMYEASVGGQKFDYSTF